MQNLDKFIEDYYGHNMQFDNSAFLNLLNELMVRLETVGPSNDKIPIILEKMMQKYQNKDFYYLIEIIEYELIPTIREKG